MKKLLLTMTIAFISFQTIAQGEFSAVLNQESDQLIISIKDDERFPPFEAAALWSLVKGDTPQKNINEINFKLKCYAYSGNTLDVIGSCIFKIPMSLFESIGPLKVLKLKAAAALRLNRYFTDSAYITFQGGRAYLSSYNTRREFFFGIQDYMIQK